jgi:tRNA-specific 2-thiouridylase
MLTALVAMSGGVDSTVAARLAQVAGFSCEGALMKLYHTGTDGGANSNPNTTTNSKPNSKPNSKANTTTNTKPNTKTNTTPNGEADARAAAKQLGIPLHIYDFTENFAEHVIKRFIAAYREGRTPNPCVDCNKHLKFGLLLEKARELGMGCIVTGHYARIERAPGGRYLLKKGADASKDQSYVLYSLTQEQLSQTRFPLGGLTKTEVREIALAEGFQNAKKNESQDICFVPDGDYAGFIEDYTGEAPRRGRFVDKDGNDLGEN